MESTQDKPRPLTSPAAVSCAALVLVAMAGASFTSALNRQLRLPRPVNTAKVVVMAPKEAPQAGLVTLAYMAPVTPPPARVPAKPHRRPHATPDEAPPAAPLETATVARAAPLEGADVVTVVPVAPPETMETSPTTP
jgi:hypothetical protein